MKRITPLIIGIAISAFMGMTVSSAFNSDDTILTKLFEAAGINNAYNNDAKELEKLASDSDFAFENLYLFLYQNLKEAPLEETIKQLKSRTDYSENELEAILIDGNIGTILDRSAQKAIDANSEDFIAEQQAARDEADAANESFLAAVDMDEEWEAWWNDYYVEFEQPPVYS